MSALAAYRTANADHPGVTSSAEALVPLSQTQLGLWIIQQGMPDTTAYNVPTGLHFVSGFDPALFRFACRQLISHHPVLGSRIVLRDGVPQLRAGSRVYARYHHEFAADRARALAYLRRKTISPMPLNERDPGVCRIHLVSTPGDGHFALFGIHHIVFDGASIPLLCHTIVKTYSALAVGRLPKLAPRPMDYTALASFERMMLASPSTQRHRAYWQAQLRGPLPVLAPPTTYPRKPGASVGASLSFDFDAEETRHLYALCRAERLRPAAIFLTVYQWLLHVCTSQEDIIVGMPVRAPSASRFEGAIGNFTNMVAIRTLIRPDLSDVAQAHHVQRAMADALEHADYPFPQVVRDLKLPRSATSPPVFQVAFVYQGLHSCEPRALDRCRGVEVTHLEEFHQRGEYELVLEVIERIDRFRVRFKYDSRLYDATAIDRLRSQWGHRMSQVLRMPHRPPRERPA